MSLCNIQWSVYYCIWNTTKLQGLNFDTQRLTTISENKCLINRDQFKGNLGLWLFSCGWARDEVTNYFIIFRHHGQPWTFEIISLVKLTDQRRQKEIKFWNFQFWKISQRNHRMEVNWKLFNVIMLGLGKLKMVDNSQIL